MRRERAAVVFVWFSWVCLLAVVRVDFSRWHSNSGKGSGWQLALALTSPLQNSNSDSESGYVPDTSLHPLLDKEHRGQTFETAYMPTENAASDDQTPEAAQKEMALAAKLQQHYSRLNKDIYSTPSAAPTQTKLENNKKEKTHPESVQVKSRHRRHQHSHNRQKHQVSGGEKGYEEEDDDDDDDDNSDAKAAKILTTRLRALALGGGLQRKVVLGRRLLYSHHIINMGKRTAVVQWAVQLGLSGCSKIGWPGVIIVEGLEQNVREYVDALSRLKWKHFAIRGEEIIEGKEGQSLDSLRAFPKGFTEYGVNGMPEVAELCRDRGLGALFDTLFKRYPKQDANEPRGKNK
mmetsp:Transcript_22590/g.39941  ORF Transcript_22590/g.39941 Transcript_22590/m.39941 type:complete len:348 (+) Transcript_22590:115-1158(+)